MEVVASLSQGRTAAAQCGLFTHKSVPVIFEPPCIMPACKRDIRCLRYLLSNVIFRLKIFKKSSRFRTDGYIQFFFLSFDVRKSPDVYPGTLFTLTMCPFLCSLMHDVYILIQFYLYFR